MRRWSLLCAQLIPVQVSPWVGLGWEVTMILHPGSEKSLAPCSVVMTSPFQASVVPCLVLTVILRVTSFPLARGYPWPLHLLAVLWPPELRANQLLVPAGAVCLLM